MYEYQAKSLDVQDKILSARNLPKLSLFVQGGYGRPALNMLSNDLELYYIGGLRLNWSLSALYTMKRERAVLDISRKTIDAQKETFLFNTNFTLRQQSAEVNKYNDLLAADAEIVALRTSVKNTASVQLENGVINTNDYLREVNAEDQARQNKIVHEIQWLMAQYALQVTTGDPN
jgi:outer membrane protein TolC